MEAYQEQRVVRWTGRNFTRAAVQIIDTGCGEMQRFLPNGVLNNSIIMAQTSEQ
jgi:hypothetical protein